MAKNSLLMILLISVIAICLVPGCSKSNPVTPTVSATDDGTTVTDEAGTAKKSINAYVAYDNTVTTSEASGVVRQARDNIKAQFTTATWTFTYNTLPKWSSPSSPSGSVDMITDLQADFPGYPNGSYHTCIGISRKPTAANADPGLEGGDHCFIDYKPGNSYDPYVVGIVMHEWGHSLGVSYPTSNGNCTNTSCVMNTYGWSHGSTTYCSTCRAKIKAHLGI